MKSVVNKPWGSFEIIDEGANYTVKKIIVHPEGKLSLQSHKHRSEHWVVVEGTAKVTIGTNVTSVPKGQSVFVPLGVVHRLENPGKTPMTLIEVQTGTYLGEDDINRYEDLYARNNRNR